MKKSIIALILILSSAQPAIAASAADLAESAPDRYVVVPGDTLWGISSRFLKDPWRWGELWKMNQEQIKNPHRIYPGDVIVLDRSAEEMRLSLVKTDTVKLSPVARATPLAPEPIPTIPSADIEPFLSQPLVVAANQLESAPRIVATQESRVALGAGNVAYVKGITKDQGAYWKMFRRHVELVDPDSKESLGYEALYLGDARVVKFGDPATIEILTSALEVTAGTYLLPAPKEVPLDSYVPHAPAKPVKGRIISAYTSLYEIGPGAIVALSRGARDGLEVGHVLAIARSEANAAYALREASLYGRTGIVYDPNNPKTDYRSEPLLRRDAPYMGRYGPFGAQFKGDALPTVSPPNERYGLLLVFRVFDRAAYALIMHAERPVNVLDVVTNP
jgi:hypothetical protein